MFKFVCPASLIMCPLCIAAYNPPPDLLVVEPVLRASVTPADPSLHCKEHGILFRTKYFAPDKQRRGSFGRVGSFRSKTKEQAAERKRVRLEVKVQCMLGK